MLLKEEIKKIANVIKKDIVNKRRFLHQNPELSFNEFNTSAFIKKSLDELDIPWTSVAGTGVKALVKGKLPSDRVISLRAEMDALPIYEKNQVDYKSVNDGVMHACGHDVHMASALGVAQVLKKLNNSFKGTVKLIFQPAEEIMPGGAKKIIGEGALINPKVDAMLGQHVMPSILCGKVAVRSGKFMASMDEIKIRVIGKGGHGAEPYKVIDPVTAAATLIITLQQVVSRKNNPSTPTVLSFGKLQANGSINIIPDEVLIEGTFRTMDEKWRGEAHKQIISITESVVKGLGCDCVVEIRKGYPCLHNDTILTDKVRNLMEDYLGKDNVIDADIWMASEDFAYYSEILPSCFYLLGVGNDGEENHSLHTSTFNINEDSIEVNVGLMSYILLRELGNRFL